MPESTSEFIGLAGGLTVPLASLTLLWALENRGLNLAIDGDRLRVSGPGGVKPELSDDDRLQITKYKYHLMALVAYVPPENTTQNNAHNTNQKIGVSDSK